MIRYQNASRRPSAFLSMFGFRVADFDTLLAEFLPAHQQRLAQQTLTKKDGQPRRRAPGAGPKFAHDLRDRLLLALFWLRTYPTFELLGFFFDLDKTSAEDNLKDMLATLESMTDFTLERPSKDRQKLHTIQEVLDAFPELAVLIDAKEQRVQRPSGNASSGNASSGNASTGNASTGNVTSKAETGKAETGKNDAQKPYYSGKKKCHTLKNQVTVTPEGMIQAVSDSVPGGANHDLTLLRDSHLLDQLQDDEAAMMDKGYVGIRNDYPNKRLYLPFKASRGHPLTEEQKAYNRHLSRYRIVIEHNYHRTYDVAVERLPGAGTSLSASA